MCFCAVHRLTDILSWDFEFFLAWIFSMFSCAPFLACLGYLLGSILFISTPCRFPVSAKFTMNFNFVVAAVALTGLFGLAFALIGITGMEESGANACSMSHLIERLPHGLLSLPSSITQTPGCSKNILGHIGAPPFPVIQMYYRSPMT